MMRRPALLLLLLLAAAGASAGDAGGQVEAVAQPKPVPPTPKVSLAAFRALQKELLTGTSAKAANDRMAALATSGQCELVEMVLHSVGHCAFVEEAEPQYVQQMDRWLKKCNLHAGSDASKERFDNWYFDHVLHEMDVDTQFGVSDIYKRMEELSSEISFLGATVAEERELAFGKRDYIDVIDKKKGAVDINKLIKAHEELDAKLKDGERPLGALNFLAFLSHHENPFLLSRDEQWKLLNAQACARCTFTRATLRREEAGWELLALLSTRAYKAMLHAACPSYLFLVDPPGYDHMDRLDDVIGNAVDYSEAVRRAKAEVKQDFKGDKEEAICDGAANAFVISTMSMSNTKAGVALFRDLFKPVLDHLATKTGALGLSLPSVAQKWMYPVPRFGITDTVRGNMRMSLAVSMVAIANSGDLVRAVDPKLEGKFKGEDVVESIVFQLMFSKDFAPYKATLKLMTSSVFKLTSTELMSFDRLKPQLLADRKWLDFMIDTDNSPLKMRSRAASIRGAWYKKLIDAKLPELDEKLVKQINGVKKWTHASAGRILSKIPGGAKAFEFLSGLGMRVVPKLNAVGVLTSALNTPASLVDFLKNSLALQEFAEWVAGTFKLPASFKVTATRLRVKYAKLSNFQLGRSVGRGGAGLAVRVAARTVKLTNMATKGAMIVAKTAGKTALKLVGPVSLALDAYDAGVMFMSGHYAAGAVKVGAFAVGALAMCMVGLTPGIGLIAIGLSVALSALADHMVHVKEKNAQHAFAAALGFEPGADRAASFKFTANAKCEVFTHERKETLQSVLGGLIDGWTSNKYERAAVRLFNCLAEEDMCGMARSLATHSSGQLSGKSLMSHMHGSEDTDMARALSRCGVNPGFDAWASYARIYVAERKCADLAKDPYDYHQKLMKRLLAWYSTHRHENSLYGMLHCLRQQGKCETVRKLVEEYGFSSLIWRVGSDSIEKSMKQLLKDCNFRAFDNDDWAREEIMRRSKKNTIEGLGKLTYRVQATLFRALFDGATLDDDEDAVVQLLRAIKRVHGHRSPRLFQILNSPSLGATYEHFESNLHGKQWQEARALLPRSFNVVKCHTHKGKYVVSLGSRGCKNTNWISTCDSDGACQRDIRKCPHKCACGDSYFNECLCVRPADLKTEACRFEGGL